MLKAVYFHYYQFYTKVVPDDQPNATVIFVLSFIESLLVIALIDFYLLKFHCQGITKWPMISVAVALIIFNYLYYYRSGLYVKILESQGESIKNMRLSRLMTLFISLVIVSWMFWGPVYGKYVLEACN
mgnify:CR=1 FL=1